MYSYCGNNPINRLDPGGDRFLYIDFGDNIPTPSIGVGGGAGGIAAAVLVVGMAAAIQDSTPPEVDKGNIDWEGSDHDHILKGTNGKHVNGWNRFGFDPKDPNNWSTLLPIIQQVVQETDHYKVIPAKGALDGWVWFYKKSFAEIGVEVVVKIWGTVDGVIQKLSDAIPYIK